MLMENNPRYCRNCSYPLAPYGEYCPQCAQRYTDGRVSLRALWQDFVASILNFDSRLLRSLGALLVPGKLTAEYFMGRHQRYLSPLRLFFVMAVFCIAMVGFIGSRYIQEFREEVAYSGQKQAYQEELGQQLDSARIRVQLLYPDSLAGLALDTLQGLLLNHPVSKMILGVPKRGEAGGYVWRDVLITWWDVLYLTLDEIYEKHELTTFWERLMVGQFVKFLRPDSNFINFFLGKLVWMALLMMPVLALTLKLLYLRRRRYFVEHLIFSYHYHAFAFLLIGLLLLGLKLAGAFAYDAEEAWPGWFPLALLAILLYLYVAMKRFYAQPWGKTFLKFVLVNISYLFIFTVALVLTFIGSALLF
jgi:hypothetical protein